jgi:cystathionine beta-lyase/cystathionine gamma-synthase
MTTSPIQYSTLAVHAGQYPDPLTGAVNVPVYLSSTFELTGIGTDRGWDYSRAGNPTRDRLEEALAALEGGTSGHAFTTGWRRSRRWWRCCARATT